MKRWHELLEAALDQPNPTPELILAIEKITVKPKTEFSGPATLAKKCPDCSARNHVRRKCCMICGRLLRV